MFLARNQFPAVLWMVAKSCTKRMVETRKKSWDKPSTGAGFRNHPEYANRRQICFGSRFPYKSCRAAVEEALRLQALETAASGIFSRPNSEAHVLAKLAHHICLSFWLAKLAQPMFDDYWFMLAAQFQRFVCDFGTSKEYVVLAYHCMSLMYKKWIVPGQKLQN